MPSIDLDFLKQIKQNFLDYKVFIETGTHLGETIFKMENFFEELHTIELSEYYYNRTKNQYKGNKINFILGDSSEVFVKLLPTIENKSIFFLDGHYSAGDTAKGKKDVPLIEECVLINNLFKNEAILIIDDCRLFGDDSFKIDWTEISNEKILSIFKNRLIDNYFLDSSFSKNDRLIIHIKSL